MKTLSIEAEIKKSLLRLQQNRLIELEKILQEFHVVAKKIAKIKDRKVLFSFETDNTKIGKIATKILFESVAQTIKNMIIYGTIIHLSIKAHKEDDTIFVSMQDKNKDINSNFTCIFPLVYTKSKRKSLEKAKKKDKINILIVDDDEISNKAIIKKMVQDYLNEIGILDKSLIKSAYNGKEAINLVQEYEFDIVFMDIVMPLMDGFETTKRIRMNSFLQHQPLIIMVTALSDSKSLQEGFISGANWYITKPYDEAELEMILNDIIAGKLIETSFKQKPIISLTKKKSSKKNQEVQNQTKEITIDAKTFMKRGLIIKDEIDDLKDLFEKYDDNFDIADDEYFIILIKIIEEFVSFFDRAYEFQDLAYAFENLKNILSSREFEEDKIYELKQLFDSIVNNLKLWSKDVLIEQSSRNICYLNATFLADIAKIDMIQKDKV